MSNVIIWLLIVAALGFCALEVFSFFRTIVAKRKQKKQSEDTDSSDSSKD